MLQKNEQRYLVSVCCVFNCAGSRDRERPSRVVGLWSVSSVVFPVVQWKTLYTKHFYALGNVWFFFALYFLICFVSFFALALPDQQEYGLGTSKPSASSDDGHTNHMEGRGKFVKTLISAKLSVVMFSCKVITDVLGKKQVGIYIMPQD